MNPLIIKYNKNKLIGSFLVSIFFGFSAIFMLIKNGRFLRGSISLEDFFCLFALIMSIIVMQGVVKDFFNNKIILMIDEKGICYEGQFYNWAAIIEVKLVIDTSESIKFYSLIVDFLETSRKLEIQLDSLNIPPMQINEVAQWFFDQSRKI